MFTVRDHLGSPPVFGETRLVHLFIYLCFVVVVVVAYIRYESSNNN
jgi:cytochrome b561